MLQIIINESDVLDLSPNTKITIEKTNPAFQRGLTAEAYTYPITIPATDRNRRLLGHLHMPEAVARLNLTCRVIAAGIQFMDGSLYIQKATADTYQCAIIGTKLSEKILNTFLPDLELGGTRNVATDDPTLRAHAAATTLLTPDQSDYVFFPIANPKFHEQATLVNGTTNLYDPATAEFRWDLIISTWEFPAMPFPYLNYILRQIAAAADITLAGTWANDSEIKTLTIYNTYNIANLTTYTINLANHLPNIKVSELLLGLQNMFNISITASTDTGELRLDRRELTINQEPQLDLTNYAIPRPTVEQNTTPTQGYRFLSQPDDADSISVIMAKQTNNYPDIIGVVPTPAALPPPTTNGQAYFCTSDFRWYVTRAGNWVKSAYKGFCGTLNIDEAQNYIHTILSSLPSDIVHDASASVPIGFSSWKALYPQAAQNGQDQTFTEMEPQSYPFHPRLLFYRGLQPCNMVLPAISIGYYPMGAADVWDSLGNKMTTANYALRWDGQYGLYQTWWEEWTEALKNGKVVTYNLTLPPGKLSILIANINQKIKIDRNHYIIEKINITLSNTQGIEPITARCRLV